ncbi:MAG: AAA family ATPase [Acetobacter sp.]|nr:AAA family ATPase [Acetobacter sp.]
MELTRKQEEGLKIAIAKYNNKDPYTVISGYAGTGKTTLIRFIVSALNLNPEDVAYIAYTGKAAMVLKEKGNLQAMTSHRFLYNSKQKPDGTFFHIPKQSLPSNIKLVVVDEISMLPKQIWDLLLSHRVPVIACGDPGQLPPIGEDNEVLYHPDIFLDEVMRQAEESEIIRLSMDIRARKAIKPMHGNEVNIVTREDLCAGMFKWADQVLCGKNATRHDFNRYYRRLIWDREDEDLTSPLVGDKIICLKNNWDRINPMGDALINGMTGILTGLETRFHPILDTACYIDFTPDCYGEDVGIDTTFNPRLLIDWNLITEGEPTINKDNFKLFPRNIRPEQFDYGYVITTHKSQGSEYNKVLVIEEVLRRADHARWLYTAVTRAKEKLTLVLA